MSEMSIKLSINYARSGDCKCKVCMDWKYSSAVQLTVVHNPFVIYLEIIYFTVTVEILTVLLAGISLNNKIDDIHDRGSNNFGVLRK